MVSEEIYKYNLQMLEAAEDEPFIPDIITDNPIVQDFYERFMYGNLSDQEILDLKKEIVKYIRKTGGEQDEAAYREFMEALVMTCDAIEEIRKEERKEKLKIWKHFKWKRAADVRKKRQIKKNRERVQLERRLKMGTYNIGGVLWQALKMQIRKMIKLPLLQFRNGRKIQIENMLVQFQLFL